MAVKPGIEMDCYAHRPSGDEYKLQRLHFAPTVQDRIAVMIHIDKGLLDKIHEVRARSGISRDRLIAKCIEMFIGEVEANWRRVRAEAEGKYPEE